MASNAVVIFGAGATKACGGPLTDEILHDLYSYGRRLESEGLLSLLNSFLVECFHVPEDETNRKKEDYPSLPLLLSLIDVSIDKKEPIGQDWDIGRLVQVREALEYGIFKLLEKKLTDIKHLYLELFEKYDEKEAEPCAISLNYDIIADNSILLLSKMSLMDGQGVPNYGCEIETAFYRKHPKFGTLLKLHGSLNWLYCPGCRRLDLGISEASCRTFKVTEALWSENKLENRYGKEASKCSECDTGMRPVLITPTHTKDYRNPHISQVWYQAERLLRAADRVIVVGYSLPEDDVEVIYLLKRSLEGLSKRDPEMITVVEYDERHRDISAHPVGLRYRALFGGQIDWQTGGFEGWLEEHRASGLNPLDGPLPKTGGR